MVPSRLKALFAAWNWDVAVHILKTAFAVALAWTLCVQLFPFEYPVFGPVAALLVLQGTVYQTFRVALARSVGVVAGVLLAMVFGRWLGVTPWCIGLIVACGLTIGRLLKLGTQSIQVAVSALLVLAVGGLKEGDYAAARILETILGGAVGVAVHVLVRPPVHVGAARRALRGAAHNLGKTLHRIGLALRQGSLTEAASLELLLSSREQTRQVAQAAEAVNAAEDSLRFNFKHKAAMGDAVDVMQEQLGILERLVVQTRSVARALHDMSGAGIVWDTATSETVGQCLLVAGFAATRYGDYLDGQADSRARLAGAFQQLDEELRKATAALSADAEREPARWDANGSVQTSLRRFLEELRPLASEEKSATGGR